MTTTATKKRRARNVSDLLVCKAYAEREAGNRDLEAFELLHKWTGEPVDVCAYAIIRAWRRSLIAPGTTLASASLTDKGKALLERDYSNETG